MKRRRIRIGRRRPIRRRGSRPRGPGSQGRRRRRRRADRWYALLRVALWILVPVAALAVVAIWEMRTSTFQSRYFAGIGEEISFQVEEGPSARIRFPAAGPMDERLGYTAIPRMVDTLVGRGFRIERQARVSERFAEAVDEGLFPPYHEKLQGGLVLRDRRGQVFHRSPSPARVYTDFDSIPPLVVESLLFIESRELLDPGHSRRNPAVEWDRLARSVFEMALNTLGSERNVPGGSTLATQLEKFRHSPGGLTRTPGDKLQQMRSAALRAYLDGRDTYDARRRIVRNYLNSVPLAAQRSHGEVVGTADGLFAWYGTDFEEANHLLRGRGLDAGEQARRALVYRQVLSLLIAHRRPSYYLSQEEGRRALADLTDQHLRLFAREGVIPQALADEALGAEVELLAEAPSQPPVSFVERKAANQVRTTLLALLGIPQLYDLDRYDLTATTTLDMTRQEGVAELLASLADPTRIGPLGFAGDRLLDRGDPSKVLYSFTLMETTPLGNVVRIETDTYEGPLSLTGAGRLELGSTAKLRTLVTYLEVVAELHGRLSPLPADSLRRIEAAPRDVLTRWARNHLLANPSGGLRAMLEAAMERRYSANPGERFATGGGIQTFSNFDRTYDASVLTVREAFRQSVNLPWVRVMRDVVNYFVFGAPGATGGVLDDVDDPARQAYLARFADQEGSSFLRQFHAKLRDEAPDEVLDAVVGERRLSPQRLAWTFRAVVPEAGVDELAGFVLRHAPDASLSEAAIEDLYLRADPSRWDLNDLGYLSTVHPLELWLARYLRANPGATQSEVLEASVEARQEVYRWLFRTSRRNAQDQRIRTILELEAFQKIHEGWRRVGYPFANIVPSFGTAIGSSGDRPQALAELMGILLNDGVRYPLVRVDTVHFAEGTPFETRMVREPRTATRVLPSEVAAVARGALVDVVRNGTGRRALDAVTGPEGRPLLVGGKTGTGDNRFRVFGPGGQLLESRIVNRTSTFVFFFGDRYFGVVTAYVPGPDAAAFRFTSALPAQVFRAVGPLLSPPTL